MKKLISIVTSAYNEENNIDELSRQLKKVFKENTQYEYEVIFVENGSTDRTYEKMYQVHQQDPRFKIVQLSRNFRMDGGITAGLHFARGDAAVIMTANLQDKPSLITEFIKRWEEGYENVYGIVKKRTGKSLFRKLNSQLFYLLAKYLTGNIIPENASDFRLVDKKVYQTINNMNERNRFMRGMFAWSGFKSIGVEYERADRFAGKSHAHFFHVLQLAVHGIFAFSYMPLRFIAVLGFIVSFLSLLYLLYMVIIVFIRGVPFPGFGTIISLILLMFGLLFLTLGIIGQYIAQIYEEVKERPNYIVRDVTGFQSEK